jgi:tetratricopeptide (TPR) repeat protein
LGVDSVMTGRITERGESLIISVNLVDIRNGRSLWGEQYERKMSELMATQREIANEITNKLQLKLSGNEKGLTKSYTDNNEAYQLYLKGRFHLGRRTRADLFRAIEYFQSAIQLDPNFALAYARIAETYNQMPPYAYLSPSEAVPKAKAAATKTLELDPTLAEGHAALANTLAVYEWNWTEAESEFKKAIELDPNSAATYVRYAQVCLSPQGRNDEAIAAFKRALDIEPLDLSSGALASNAYLVARRYDEAIEQAKTVYDVDPSHVSGRYFLAEAYNGKGMYGAAIELSELSLQTDPTSQLALNTLGYAYAKLGQRIKAEEVINRYKEISRNQYVAPYLLAIIYAALGDDEQAFAELDKSYAAQDWHFQRLKTDPLMDSLRDDPRYKELLKRMNLPE